MPEFLTLVLLFAVGILAGFMNVMAGGGSTLTLPSLIFLGLDSATANGTNRVAILIQNISAIASFRRRQIHEFKNSFKLGLLTLPGAIVGSLLAVKISDVWFQRILAVVMIGIVVSMLTPAANLRVSRKEVRSRWLIYPAMFGIGFYGGFIQVGVGFLLMASLFYLLHLDLVHVNMHKVFIVLVYTVPALGVFLWSGNIDWLLGFVLAAGNAVGGWWSAHIQVKKGERFIKYVLAVAIIAMSLKLLGIV